MHSDLAVIIPTYFGRDTPPELRRRLMRDAVCDLGLFVAPSNWVVVLDGAPWARGDVLSVLDEVRNSGKPVVVDVETNIGKGGAVVAGIRAALEEVSGCAALAVMDCDGDHSAHDLTHLVELLAQVRAYTGRPLVEVVGRRIDRHGCLGFIRAELEGVTSRVTFASLRFALAREAQALDETWVAPFGEPDLEAGFRVYTREAAELVARALPAAAQSTGDEGLLRWGVEVVPTTEICLAGGVHAEGLRSTRETQPATEYLAGVDPAEAYSLELSWVLRRCGIGAGAALLMLEDAFMRSKLRSEPVGARCAERIVRSVASSLAGGAEALERRRSRPPRRL